MLTEELMVWFNLSRTRAENIDFIIYMTVCFTVIFGMYLLGHHCGKQDAEISRIKERENELRDQLDEAKYYENRDEEFKNLIKFATINKEEW